MLQQRIVAETNEVESAQAVMLMCVFIQTVHTLMGTDVSTTWSEVT